MKREPVQMILAPGTDAAEHLQAIQDFRAQIRGLEAEIRKRRNRLAKMVVEAFNKESAPIDGMMLEGRDVVISFEKCDRSPIGVCVYSDMVVTLPGQRKNAEWRAARKGTPDEHRYPTDVEEARTDACLFCGVVGGEGGDYLGMTI
jgi:hypothetical protein